METLKKYWFYIVLFVVFFNVGYFAYRYKDNFKLLFLLNQQVGRIESVENSVKDLNNKIDGLKDLVEKNIQKPEEKPAEKNQKRFRRINESN